MSHVTSDSGSKSNNNNTCCSSSRRRSIRSMDSNSTAADIKSKVIQRRYDCYRKKRKRPCKVAVIPTSVSGEEINCTATSSHGFISVIGRRRAMEDAVKVVPGFVTAERQPSPSLSCGYDFFAVYDGHGGTTVANACRDRLHLLLAEEMKSRDVPGLDWYEAMCSCFMKMDHEIGVGGGGDGDDVGGNTVGSTAAVVVVGMEEIVVANCGDSRVVLCRGGVAVPLSRDHKVMIYNIYDRWR